MTQIKAPGRALWQKAGEGDCGVMSERTSDGWGWRCLRAMLVVALVLSFSFGSLAESFLPHDAVAIATSAGDDPGARDDEIAAGPADAGCGLDPGCMPGLISDAPTLTRARDTGSRLPMHVPGLVSLAEPLPDHPPTIL